MESRLKTEDREANLISEELIEALMETIRQKDMDLLLAGRLGLEYSFMN